MKTRNVIVPKHLIVEWLEHPEPYGEAIVVLVNGMWTDIYTLEDGTIITPTNDVKLTKYLRRNKKPKNDVRPNDLIMPLSTKNQQSNDSL